MTPIHGRKRDRRRQGRPESSSPSHLRPRKSLGQNFLRDPNIARKIVQAINPRPSDVILEIGPGEGAITRYLVTKVRTLIVVDVDPRVVERVGESFPGTEIIHDDFLQVDLDRVAREHGGAIRVAGNIPYNITSPILFHLLDHRASVADATLMLQKEVAQRLASRPGRKDYGILSVFFQLFTSVNILFDVSCHAFYPEPDVTSSVIQFRSLRVPRHELMDEEIFRSMVRSVFGKRRKMLRGSMKYFCNEHGFRLPEEQDLTRRPEDLSIAELVRMSNALVEAGTQE